ncbi:DNA alkylation repair protein [Brevibacillus choshinensis]|uniref:DNA alkylation repair protein n=1 Tax=Brevibacillus choshinensis TaxID=54911 RepID=A0ABX7FV71_BRECH|nr:DNA alkylation repair protein [Brevibacillus choshinensis]QRG69246.1 DNA alkylation repair protein [Brevibacillus choshinensis]
MAQSFTEAAVLLFANRANQEAAGPMEAYMKNQFPFLGVKTPLRRELSKRLYREQGIPENWETVVRELWALPEREYQYVALDLLEKVKKRFAAEHVGLAEELITGKSWWDTVDYLASHMVGTLFRLNPALIGDNNERWLEGANLWLQRTTLLFQLSYKEKTDEELLFKNIRFCAASKEFFIQKAIGWSLREYAKTNPEAVRHFVEMTPLAGLSRREALKHF